MDWITKLNSTIDYIEEHLKDEIDYCALAKIACCSSYHYQRMFAYMAGVPLSEYIRRRKMTLATVDLQMGAKIIDVALKYGYASPTSFNRAFQSINGVPPSMAKENGTKLKSYSKISFIITIKGAEKMDYKIEKKEAFRIVGISANLEKDTEKNFQVVPKMWSKALSDGTIGKLSELMNNEPMGMLGVSTFEENGNGKYFIAVSTTSPQQNGFEQYAISANTWAIFSGKGTAISIQELEKRIFTEWLPNSGYEYANAPDIEVYKDPDPNNGTYEVWIAVTKK